MSVAPVLNLQKTVRVWPLLAIMAIASGQALGTVVIPMTVPEIADYSGQVIVGEITTMVSQEDGRGGIETVATLEGIQYLKGKLPNADSSFVLTLPGGSLGDLQMRLSGAPKVEVGQRWVFFLLPTYKTFPTAGFDQGAMLLLKDSDGVERVHSATGHPIIGLNELGAVLTASPRRSPPTGRLVGSNRARLAKPSGSDAIVADTDGYQAMTLASFIELIQPILDASKCHDLTEPAGKRIFPDYTPTTIKRANVDGPESVNKTPSPRPEKANSALRTAAAHTEGEEG